MYGVPQGGRSMKTYLVAMNDKGIVFTPYSYGFEKDPQWTQQGDILSMPVFRVPRDDSQEAVYAEVVYKLWIDEIRSMGQSGISALWIALRVHYDHKLEQDWITRGWQTFAEETHEAIGYQKAREFMLLVQSRWTARALYTPSADPISLLGTS